MRSPNNWNSSPALTALATDWRKLLFPEANNAQFADGYAQAVTFGLLMARAREIELSTGLDQAAKKLGQTNSLIGAALRLLTDDADNQKTLKTSLGTLTRVLDAVDWHAISNGNPDAWLYFYEDFLEVYDNDLRKRTGSYYTPPEVVGVMVRLVDDVLRGRFQQPWPIPPSARELFSSVFLAGSPHPSKPTKGLGPCRKQSTRQLNGSSPLRCSLVRSPSLNFAFTRNYCTSSGKCRKRRHACS
jgi:hypothetical protein